MGVSAWREISLGEICEFKYGKSLPKKERIPGRYPVYGSNGKVGSHNQALTNGPTVIIGRKGSFGEVAYSDSACWPIDTTYFIDSTATQEDLKWLSYRIRNLGLTELNRAAAIPGLNREDAYRKRLLLPPLDEQRRIAAVLDKVDALRAKRREAIALLDELAQSVFLDMFGKAKQATGRWKTETLQNLSVGFRYGTSNKSTKEGYPTLRIPNVIGDELDTSDLKFVPVPPNEFNRLRLIDGDLLFVRTNGNPDFVGRCSIFTEEAIKKTRLPADQFIYASYLIRVRLKTDTALPTYVREFMRTSEGRSALRSNSRTSAGQYNINTKGLGSIEIPVPPLDIQKNFEERLASIRRLKEAHRTHLAHLDELFASLQQRAFRGELFSSEAA